MCPPLWWSNFEHLAEIPLTNAQTGPVRVIDSFVHQKKHKFLPGDRTSAFHLIAAQLAVRKHGISITFLVTTQHVNICVLYIRWHYLQVTYHLRLRNSKIWTQPTLLVWVMSQYLYLHTSKTNTYLKKLSVPTASISVELLVQQQL